MPSGLAPLRPHPPIQFTYLQSQKKKPAPVTSAAPLPQSGYACIHRAQSLTRPSQHRSLSLTPLHKPTRPP